MSAPYPRLAVRAIIKHEGRLLLVNAYADPTKPLMCAPGGGVERGSALPDNLKREVWEECGLDVEVGAPCLVNEFHDPNGGFHQVDLYFHCALNGAAAIDPDWRDREAIVNRWRWVTQDELAQTPHKPDSLAAVAFGPEFSVIYDPLEPIVR
ncbi:NUDIX domain-containing protein [Sulfitobacter sp. JB4-11]|uniref:NUDIX domain-containing protein n=1 Tax=Sulfitobacter rhodophyticola TaxID=3238304 RepID=UPI0035134654